MTQTPFTAAQQGVVLITSLIILLVATLIGSSAMRGALFEETMAANDMEHAAAFQAAESAVEVALEDTANLSDSLDGSTVTVSVDLGTAAATGSGEVSFLGQGLALGYEIGDEDSYASFFFDVRGSGEVSAVAARRTTAHGVRVLGPG